MATKKDVDKYTLKRLESLASGTEKAAEFWRRAVQKKKKKKGAKGK